MTTLVRKERKIRTIFSVICLLLVCVTGALVAIAYLNQSGEKPDVLSATDDITVNVGVYGCLLQVTTHPERRIPGANNWDTILSVAIYDSVPALITNVTITTDAAGTGTANLCDQGVFLMAGTYSFRVRGYSHLRRNFNNLPSFVIYGSTHDFTTGGTVLLAGETSVTFDNRINMLDLSTQLRNIYTATLREDLNNDGLVNALDLSNTFANYQVGGD